MRRSQHSLLTLIANVAAFASCASLAVACASGTLESGAFAEDDGFSGAGGAPSESSATSATSTHASVSSTHASATHTASSSAVGSGTTATGTGGASTGAGTGASASVATGATGASTGASTGSGGMQSCCTPGQTPGCSDSTVETCVCAQDSYCCTVAWDSICVGKVASLACGSCGNGSSSASSGSASAGSGTGGGGQQACCDTAMTPGCGDKTVEQCVCKQDGYCCGVEWDSLCVQEVDSFGCGPCGGGMGGGGMGGGGMGGGM